MEVCWKLLTFGVQIIGQAIVFSVILDIVISLFVSFFSPPTLSDLLLMLNSWVNSNIVILDTNIAKTG